MGDAVVMTTRTRGFLFGLLGVLGFSLTLPMTRIAVASLDPLFVGLGRGVLAAILAATLLVMTRQTLPPWRYWPRFIVVSAGAVIGFPWMSALAMQQISASHGAVITGLIPLATALGGLLRGGERPSLRFWCSAIAGSVLVLVFAAHTGAGAPSRADWLMFASVATAAVAYTEGALLARIFGAWQVICWALLLALPILLPLLWHTDTALLRAAPLSAWLAFVYVGAVSMWLAFFAWYRGLALGGIASVGQVQQLQPFFTFIAAAFLLGEQMDVATLACAAGVVVCLLIGNGSLRFSTR
jgi:drug/metabolite transporter (DMT)-like permease